jgi:RNA polymerase sigma-70 factor (ECF subfamily)
MHDDLLRRLRAGHDPEALARLIELDQAGIYHFMQRRLGHRQDAEDATQEVFRRVIRSLPSLRDSRGYRGWLYQIALRVAHAQIDARIEERRRVETMARTAAADESFSMDASDSEDRRARIRTAVDALDEELRTVVLLRYEQGLSYEEIAEATQRPMGTVSKRLHTAHQKLQQALAAVGIALAAGALEVKAFEAVPEGLAGRLKEMALHAPPRSTLLSPGRLGGIAAASLLAVLVVSVPLVRTLKGAGGGAPSLASENAVRSPKATESRSPPMASAPVEAVEGANRAAERGILRGIVRDRETHAAVVGASVWLEPGGSAVPELRTETTTGADGSFRLEAPAGPYTLDAMAPGHVRHGFERIMESYRTRYEAGDPEKNDAAAEAVRESNHLKLEAGVEKMYSIDLVRAIRLHGLVVDAKGRPVPGAQVELDALNVKYCRFDNGNLVQEFGFTTKYEPDGRTSTYVADLQGRFEISNVYPTGDVTLTSTAKGFQERKEVVTLDRRDLEITLVLEPGFSFGGRVLSADGQGIASACVFLLAGPGGPETKALTCGKGGEFEVLDQPRGLRLAAVFAPGYAPRVLDFSSGDPGRIEVVLTPSEKASAEGLITDELGRPVEGADVAVHHYALTAAGARVQMVFTDRNGGGSATHDVGDSIVFLPYSAAPSSVASLADGRFRLGDLAPAPACRIFLEVKKSGYELADIEVTPSAPLRIQLRPTKR